MYTIKRTDEFNAWLLALKDGLTHRRLLARLRKATQGNLGDVKPVGKGVFEMREHFGLGWRMYLYPAWHGADRNAGRWQQINTGCRYCKSRESRGNDGEINHDQENSYRRSARV